MRWLLIGLLISVVSLLLVAGAVTWHVRRQRRNLPADTTGLADSNEELDQVQAPNSNRQVEIPEEPKGNL